MPHYVWEHCSFHLPGHREPHWQALALLSRNSSWFGHSLHLGDAVPRGRWTTSGTPASKPRLWSSFWRGRLSFDLLVNSSLPPACLPLCLLTSSWGGECNSWPWTDGWGSPVAANVTVHKSPGALITWSLGRRLKGWMLGPLAALLTTSPG